MKSYKGFEIFINAFRMNLKMHDKILQYIFLLHILVLLAYSFFFLKRLDQLAVFLEAQDRLSTS